MVQGRMGEELSGLRYEAEERSVVQESRKEECLEMQGEEKGTSYSANGGQYGRVEYC